MTVIDAMARDDGGIHEESAAEHIHGICLKTGPPRRVGVELEWLVRDARDPSLPVPAGRIAAAVAGFGAARIKPGQGTIGGNGGRPELPTTSSAGVLPSGAPLTTEPGGQLELSSLPADSLAELARVTRTDLAALRAALAARGLELAGIGLDPLRPPRRVLDLPRYAAMESFFDSDGPWGRQMMCGTASVQVCLDAGDDSDGPSGYRWRWRLLHAIGPVLVAAFANSPLRDGKPTGWASSRQQVWARMDPGRTRPPRLDQDPRAAWTAYALDAELMCVRDLHSGDWSAPPGLTLRDWVRADGWRLRRPTVDDLDYHLSTLFPPVRPRGHFELRMIDAQPGDGWIVPLAVCWALLSDAAAGDAALAAVAPLWGGQPPGGANGDGAGGDGAGRDGLAVTDYDGPWLRAARLGPGDPLIAAASRECFAAARAALDRNGVPRDITAAVDAFREAYVSKDRCPADDLLEEANDTAH
jgi:ergothioneine biosynthesis glutamate--cysteine ligase EgtA